MRHDEHDDERPARGFDPAVWRKLLCYARPYRRDVALLALFAASTAGIEVAFPIVIGRVIDAVGEGAAAAELWRHGLLLLALAGALGWCVWSFIRVGSKLRTHVAHDIRQDGFDNLQRLSFAYFDHRPVGWLMARMTSDCERLSNVMAWGTIDVLWGLTLTGGIAAVMLAVDARLALVVLAVVPALAWVSGRFQNRILDSARRVRRTNSRLTAAFDEALHAVRTSKAFVREHEDQVEFGGLTGAMRTWTVRNALQSALFLPVVLTLGSLATGSALVVGGLDVLGERLTVGTLVAFLVYTRYFFEPIEEMAFWFAEMQMAQASAERVLGLIETEPEIRDSEAVRERVAAVRAGGGPGPEQAEDGLPDRIGRIELRRVGFVYRGGERVLDGFDLAVEPGETVALVGPTGGGKSTIVNLLCRFYEPTEGEILFDGVDYRRRSLGWLQSNLGIVLQTPHLFGGTVLENIRYGDLSATDAEVVEAARLAGAHEFVEALERGYLTDVGEGGSRLSTGQKQLVSFARAILARPALLVMDEATSSVDTETERRIQAALARVLAGRTSFVIAHRLSTIRSADRILVIDAGRIVEQGTHAELLARRGRYFELYTEQSLREHARLGAGPEGGSGPAGRVPSPAL